MDAGEGGAGGVTGYDSDRPFAAANLRLAWLVQDDVIAAMNAQGSFEGSIAASGHGQDVIAGGIARAVEQYFGAHG